MLYGLLIIVGLAVVAALLSADAEGSDARFDALADRIDAVLPQTQCRQCGYAGCRPYAEALARGEAPIDRCPPGGVRGVHDLARLLGVERPPAAPAAGNTQAPAVALIDEALCIGCTKCIPVCPVDAIVGAPQRLHVVLAAECTGCGLCLPPCPVDCITLASPPAGTARQPTVDHARVA